MIDKNASDSQLVSRYQQGNEEAFKSLLHRHKSRVYTSIYLIVKDRYVAEDLLQETFIKVVNTIKSGRYNEEGKFLPWVCRIAHNMAIDHFRKEKRHPEITLEDGSAVFDSLQFSGNAIELQEIGRENKKWLRQCVKELPVEQKQVLIMRHFLNMSFQEIADQTGVSINTALGRMRYSLINLRKMMMKTQYAYDNSIYTKRPDQVSLPRDLGGGEPGN